jgi:thiol-disulfide isomerase/thioredoxin
MSRICLFAALLFIAISGTVLPAIGQEEAVPAKKLSPGDPAPKLKVGKWIQGEPVTELAADRAYVVEFWATWCGPCRTTIPHLNELHKKYDAKGVTFIGQNCFEDDEAKVTEFVKKMGEGMSYRVATDDTAEDESGVMARTWMSAAKQNGIPCAFLVGKDGKVAWIGHPAKLNETMLDEVLAGTWDPTKLAEPAPGAPAEGNSDAIPYGKLHRDLGAALRLEKWTEAQDALKKLTEVLPKEEQKFLDLPRLQVALGQNQASEAEKLAEDLCSTHPENSSLLQQVAWLLATRAGDKPNLPLAEKCAQKALEKAPDKAKPLIHEALARIWFQLGKKDEAKKLLKESIPSASDRLRPRLEEALKAYEADKLPAE